MTVIPNILVNDGNPMIYGKKLLSGVPENIVLTPSSGVGLIAGAFIGATASHSKSLHVFPVGVLEGHQFMCLFRFKLWWMTQRMGSCGKEMLRGLTPRKVSARLVAGGEICFEGVWHYM